MEFYIQYVPRSVNQLLVDDDTAKFDDSYLIKPAIPPMAHGPELGGPARFDLAKEQAQRVVYWQSLLVVFDPRP